jgi:hypothetical protein
MCTEYKMTCNCGTNHASFNFRDDVLPFEIINRLYCPSCSHGISYDAATMLKDNGWIIEYDMEIARFIMTNRLSAEKVTPEYIFDEGYCTWRGIYPTDYFDSVKEREDLVKLSKLNFRKYLDEFKKWGIQRIDRLAQEGWRKANERT